MKARKSGFQNINIDENTWYLVLILSMQAWIESLLLQAALAHGDDDGSFPMLDDCPLEYYCITAG